MYPNLELEMFKQKVSTKQLADACGISESAMRNKIKGRSDFKMSEARCVVNMLRETTEYLFARADEQGKAG